MTTIRTRAPEVVRKVYRLDQAGTLTKRAAASIRAGTCTTHHLAELVDLAELIEELSEQPDQCLTLGGFLDAPAFATFDLVTRPTLARMLPHLDARALPGVHRGPFGWTAARLSAGIAPSGFLHLDADNWPGMPPEWAAMTLAERVLFLAAIVPGLAACERVEARSSSARVIAPGGQPGPASHGFAALSHPHLADALRRHIARAMVARGLARPMDCHARDGSGRVTRQEWRTVFDLAVMHRGRLIFTAPPCVEAAPGYRVAPAGVRLVNEGGGPLDIGWLDLDRAPILPGWRADPPASPPMTWADDAPPHDDAERQPDPPKGEGKAGRRRIPDPATVTTGNRHRALFLALQAFCFNLADRMGTRDIPLEPVEAFALRWRSGMTCEPEPVAEVRYQAADVVAWTRQHYEPNARRCGSTKTPEEREAAMRAAREKSGETKKADTLDAMRAAVADLTAKGAKVTKAAVARATGLHRSTIHERWAKCRTWPPHDLARPAPASPVPAAPASPPVAAAAPASGALDLAAAAWARRSAARRAARAPLRLDVLRRLGRLAKSAAAGAEKPAGWRSARDAGGGDRGSARGPPPW